MPTGPAYRQLQNSYINLSKNVQFPLIDDERAKGKIPIFVVVNPEREGEMFWEIQMKRGHVKTEWAPATLRTRPTKTFKEVAQNLEATTTADLPQLSTLKRVIVWRPSSTTGPRPHKIIGTLKF